MSEYVCTSLKWMGARGSVGIMLLAGRLRVRDPMKWMIFFFSVYLTPPAALCPEVYSAYNRNEYQKKNALLGSRARPVRNADNLTVVSEPIV
jgi:hypothetical protein